MSWSVPVFRAFGIPVRVHLLFFLVAFGFFFRQVVFTKDNPVWWGDVLLFTVFLLFAVVLLHEFGHCFGARWVDGEAKEILIWPLGGLATNDIPHGWRPLFVTVAAGPAVNVLICLGCAAGLAAGGFLPGLNPLANPYVAEVHNYRDGKDYTSAYGLKLYKPGTAEPIPRQAEIDRGVKSANEGGLQDRATFRPEDAALLAAAYGGDRAVAPGWAVWAQRAFYLSWVIFLFNLLPAYPLDGGQLLQAVVWARTDYRRGVTVACYSGLGTGVLIVLVGLSANEAMFFALGLFMLFQSAAKLTGLDAEDGPFGYDFSAGYTSLEKDDEPAPRRAKRPGAVARWWAARKARKLARELEQRQRDEDRKEYLLEKIAATGMGSLTDDERRFLQQFSSRYKHRS
ncbi:MAG: site-2 protease family protein [Gemmataceae bacterium]|nr:site-2 protease family protein [Gemmataceae bacterium]